MRKVHYLEQARLQARLPVGAAGDGIKAVRRWTLVSLVLVMAAAGLISFKLMAKDEPAQRFRLAEVTRGPLVAAVEASGNLRPRQQVAVVAGQVGQIAQLFVDENARVVADQPLARLSDDALEAKLNLARADLAVSQASVEVARGQLARARTGIADAGAGEESARAELDHAGLVLDSAQRDLRRSQSLAASGDTTKIEAEHARSVQTQAAAALDAAQAHARAAAVARAAAGDEVVVAQAQLDGAIASAGAKEGLVHSAEIDVEHATITAPIAGTVIERQATVGETVSGGQSPLFVIAGDLRRLELHTSVDEADIGRVAVGQQATFSVDAFPGETFSGRVERVRRSPEVIQNVVTYDVVVAADNPDERLLPGMTAAVRIVVSERRDVLQVPTAALRFTPPDDAKHDRPRPGARVWVQAPSGRLKERVVKTGVSDELATEITGGNLAPGEQAVVGLAPQAGSTTGSTFGF